MVKPNRNLVVASTLAVILLSAAVLELGTRALVTTTDGVDSVPILGFSVPIPPYPIPITTISEKLQRYLSLENSLMVFDPHLGWTYRPNTSFPDRGMAHNNDGIRTGKSKQRYTQDPTNDVLRIALFGDSFTHGDGAGYYSTWGFNLQRALRALGREVEVLNFGVGGYGMDQAYLRYLKEGVKYKPDIVIFGFSIENVFRNINLFRFFYKKGSSGVPFSKPRFILEEDNLVLINSPTVPPDKLLEILKNFSNWDLAEHEHFYRDDEYHIKFWQKSRFLSLVFALVRYRETMLLDDPPEGAAYQLMSEIIATFRDEVEGDNGRFLVAHLPPGNHFEYFQENDRFKYESVLKHIETLAPVFRPEKAMLDSIDGGSISNLFADHYSALGHKIIGESLAKYLADNKYHPKNLSNALQPSH